MVVCTGGLECIIRFWGASKREGFGREKKEGKDTNRTRVHWKWQISSTCNQAGIKCFGIGLNLLAFCIIETTPLNLVQTGAVVEENEHADRWNARHDKLVVLFMFAYMQMCKNKQ